MWLIYFFKIMLMTGSIIPFPVSASGQEFGKLSHESYNVYSSVIDSYFGTYAHKSIVLSDSTMLDFFYSDLRVKYQPDSLYLKGMFSSLQDSSLEELFKDYNFRNRTKYEIDPKEFATTKKLIFIKHNKFNKYFGQSSVSRGWKNFYRDYPHSIGFIQFTKVGFNHLKNKALVYMEKYCGDTCGVGIYFLLEKEKSIWKIIYNREVWVS